MNPPRLEIPGGGADPESPRAEVAHNHVMASLSDVRRIALALPGVRETEGRFAFAVESRERRGASRGRGASACIRARHACPVPTSWR